MKPSLIISALVLALGASLPALAQQQVKVCISNENSASGAQSCQDVTAANPLWVAQSFAFLNITNDATTIVKSSAGLLHAITFNAPTATETVTIYDNSAASGTKIGTITVPASPQPVTLLYDVAFANGLTIVTASATSDITVSYR